MAEILSGNGVGASRVQSSIATIPVSAERQMRNCGISVDVNEYVCTYAIPLVYTFLNILLLLTC